MKGERRKLAAPFKSLLQGLQLRPDEVASSDWEAWGVALADLDPRDRLALIRHPGRLWPAHFLCRQVWGTDDPGRSTLATRMSALRRKLGGLGSRLQNVRRRGYRFAA